MEKTQAYNLSLGPSKHDQLVAVTSTRRASIPLWGIGEGLGLERSSRRGGQATPSMHPYRPFAAIRHPRFFLLLLLVKSFFEGFHIYYSADFTYRKWQAIHFLPFLFFSLRACFSSFSLARSLSTLAHQSRLSLRCASSPQALHLMRTTTHL